MSETDPAETPYSYVKGENALGVEHCFTGPNMPHYANEIMLIQPLNDWAVKCLTDERIDERYAEKICRFLNAAFQAGKDARSAEIDRLIRGSRR